MVFIYILILFWSIRTVRQILFWLYLWQLKEYHIGRFIDHFRTAKGKQIFLNPLFFIKLALFLILVYGGLTSAAAAGVRSLLSWILDVAVGGLSVIYVLETDRVILDIGRRRIKTPVFTKKAIGLTFLSGLTPVVLIVLIAASRWNFIILASTLLLFDVFAPLVVSVIVLGLQPFAVLGRRKIIENAKRKMALFPNLITIGITGSYGKTSTKEFLALILSEKFKVLRTKEHQNSEVGVAQCILNELKPEHEVFIAEMGAYGKGGIKLLCSITKPKIGIVVGVNEQHLALFGSMKNLLSAEGGGELLQALPDDGMAIVNWDNEYIIQNSKFKIQNYNSKFKIIRYSIKSREDIWAEDIKVEKEYVSFRVAARDGDAADFRINVLGAHYVPNILAAVAAAKELGMKMAEIAEQCQKITPEMAGMILKTGINGATIIDATYSANPDGVISHLEYLKTIRQSWGKIIVVMPCLIELGKASQEAHRKIGRKIGEACDLAIITTKERFGDIKLGAMESGLKEEKILFLEKPRDVLGKIKDYVTADDVVLLEGRLSGQIIDSLAFKPR